MNCIDPIGWVKTPYQGAVQQASAHCIEPRLVDTGVADIQEGEVKDNELKTQTSGIHRMSFSKDPATTKVSVSISDS